VRWSRSNAECALKWRTGAAYGVSVECAGVLIEESSKKGSCELGDACAALALLDVDYETYRQAHRNRVGGAETGGEG
jgi:hypothetical protein